MPDGRGRCLPAVGRAEDMTVKKRILLWDIGLL